MLYLFKTKTENAYSNNVYRCGHEASQYDKNYYSIRKYIYSKML